MKNRLFLSVLLFCSMNLFAAETAPQTVDETPRSYASPINGGLEILYLPAPYQFYQWSNGSTNDAKSNGFRITAEWIPLGDSPYGKPVIGLGTGFSWIKHLALSPGYSGSLYVLPVEPYIGYRFDYFKNQFLIPFGKLGLGFAYLQEEMQVADGKRVSHNTYLGFDLSAGMEVWLNYIDRKSARSLDANTGINNVYLLVEYLKSRELGAQYANLSREEFRVGLRFEY